WQEQESAPKRIEPGTAKTCVQQPSCQHGNTDLEQNQSSGAARLIHECDDQVGQPFVVDPVMARIEVRVWVLLRHQLTRFQHIQSEAHVPPDVRVGRCLRRAVRKYAQDKKCNRYSEPLLFPVSLGCRTRTFQLDAGDSLKIQRTLLAGYWLPLCQQIVEA